MTRPIYTLLFTLLLPFVLLRLLLRSRKAPDYRKRWGERFGLFKAPNQSASQSAGIWFHTVSVGEFLAAASLIEQVMLAYPNKLITITTTTPTGSAQVRQRFAQAIEQGRVFHVYLPYDIPLFLHNFLRRIQPALLVILETELWPNLIACAKANGCRVLVANGRLSEKSAAGYAKFPKLARPLLAALDGLAAQNAVDGERFMSVGLPKSALTVTGSIKFDVQVPESCYQQAAAYRQQWGEQREVWIMASTHKGEDEIALAAHRRVLAKHADALLVIVPRHPERFNDVAQLIREQGFNLARRSQDTSISTSTEVLLVDSMGELMGFLAASQICCMGGTFTDNGGHNPLEPAALGLPVVMGPSQFNFAQICDLLTQAGALKTVGGFDDLAQQVLLWFDHQEQARSAGAQGQHVVENNRGAKERVFELICQTLDERRETLV